MPPFPKNRTHGHGCEPADSNFPTQAGLSRPVVAPVTPRGMPVVAAIGAAGGIETVANKGASMAGKFGIRPPYRICQCFRAFDGGLKREQGDV
jgi:hypothetical protein